MEHEKSSRSGLDPEQSPAIRFLVESALKTVNSRKDLSMPRTRQDWVERLTESLMVEDEAPHQSVIANLMSRGVSSQDILHSYVPAASRRLGELWVSDKVSFVDVTVGAGRLQQLFRGAGREEPQGWKSRTIPLGHSMLMVIPRYEEHSLGAFVAADNLRRQGVWVHMGIGLEPEEIAELIDARHFSALGLSLATAASVEKTAELIDFLRNELEYLPPIVLGGRGVEVVTDADRRTGADLVARSAEEAIEKCGLTAITPLAEQDAVR